ncbi:MAG: EamA family transporter [Gammaproteobacteria bacterium]|nr:MAG: EamA family transporter [Gammaproteobacteria bacterium]
MNHSNNPTHQPIWGAIWMIAAGAAFACINTALQFLGMKLGLDSTIATFFQYCFALLCLLPFFDHQRMVNAFSSKHRSLHLLRILVSVIGIQLWTWALSQVPIWQGIALLMTSPLFATLGSGLFLGEKVSITRWGTTLFGFAGAMIILAPWSDEFSYYALLPIAAAMCWAAASLMTKYSLADDSPLTVVGYMLVLMLPVNAIFVLPQFSWPASPQVWWLLIFAGILTAFAQWAIAKAYASAEASYVQPFDHVKLPLNVLAGFVVFNYIPPGQLWLGAAMIIAAVSLITFHEKHLQSKAA